MRIIPAHKKKRGNVGLDERKRVKRKGGHISFKIVKGKKGGEKPNPKSKLPEEKKRRQDA